MVVKCKYVAVIGKTALALAIAAEAMVPVVEKQDHEAFINQLLVDLDGFLVARTEYSIFKDQRKLKGKKYFKLLQKKPWTPNSLTLLTGKRISAVVFTHG
ncbi:hypothetical protein L1887_05048 [Cichorium endivia]|nr:hypothetical protein L1887_05048 [Cichorium endivia]